MPEKTLPEIVEGIKDCLLSGFAAQMSQIRAKEDGWTLGQYLEVLAHHLSPVIARFLTSVSYIEIDKSVKELKAAHEEVLTELIAVQKELTARVDDLASRTAVVEGRRPRSWPWDHKQKAQ